jgi:hypothetical protein
MSAHSLPGRRGWLSALVAQLGDYVFEEIEEAIDPEPVDLKPHPVIAVVSAAPRSGASTVARLLAAEFAHRAAGTAVVTAAEAGRRGAPPTRAAVRLATALAGTGRVQPNGRLCIAAGSDLEKAANAARYLAPVVLDLPPDGSAAMALGVADRIVVVAAASGEPALLDAVASVLIGSMPSAGDAVGSGGWLTRVANRVIDPVDWQSRADLAIPESRIAARAAVMGTRAPGPLGAAISELADSLEGVG